jgi:hypothetical protein
MNQNSMTQRTAEEHYGVAFPHILHNAPATCSPLN